MPSNNKPEATIIISTYNRQESLVRTLKSLTRQNCASNYFEVLLVDDGSTDDTASVTQMDWPFKLRYHYQTNQGIAAARNWAVANCQTEYIAFLDDDITVSADYIEAMLSPHKSNPFMITMALLQSPPNLPNTPFHYLYIHNFDGANTPPNATAASIPIPFYDCTGGVIAMRRADYIELGGTQELPQGGRTLWGGLDLAYRAYKRGFAFQRQTEAIAVHHDHATGNLHTYSQRMFQVGKYAPLLLQKYPELERLVPLFCDRAFPEWRHDPPRLTLRKSWRSVMALDTVMVLMGRAVKVLERYKLSPTVLHRLYIWIVSSSFTRGIRAGIGEFGPWEKA